VPPRTTRVAHMRKNYPAIPRSAYPVDEGCHKLGIGRTSLYAMAQAGEIRLIKIAGRTLVSPHRVLHFEC